MPTDPWEPARDTVSSAAGWPILGECVVYFSGPVDFFFYWAEIGAFGLFFGTFVSFSGGPFEG